MKLLSVLAQARSHLRATRRDTISSARRSKLAMILAAALAGGSLLSTCQTRLKDAIVSGSKDYFFTLLDPSSIAEFLLDQTGDTEEE